MKGHNMNMEGKNMQVKGRWKVMNTHWKEWKQIRETNGNQRRMKGTWQETRATLIKFEGIWLEHLSNIKRCRSTWNQQNNSAIHLRACSGMNFGFVLDPEYDDITPESDRAPRKETSTTPSISHMERILTGPHSCQCCGILLNVAGCLQGFGFDGFQHSRMVSILEGCYRGHKILKSHFPYFPVTH